MLCKAFRARRWLRAAVLGTVCGACIPVPGLGPSGALAERIGNPIAVFSGLDKITATITSFEVPLDTTVIFGVLEVTPRACYSSPPTETPKTTVFVEVNELRSSAAPRRIFAGWMFADSPGLSAVEHPVYDIWLTNCKAAAGSSSNE